ncbi:MAG: DUF493 domain-containing protein [Deltaproteobacteria bacterium]|nr:MAG: DUF493 domain-containing protein [Deltaproteobacteria bacterium]
MTDKGSSLDLLEFPCRYPFKVFTDRRDLTVFEQEVHSCAAAVVGPEAAELSRRASSRGTYICVTMTVEVNTRSQIEALYDSLRSLRGVCYLL